VGTENTHRRVKLRYQIVSWRDSDKRKNRPLSNGNGSMYSRTQFAALELMCRERAALAKMEMEYLLAEYWLAEAEEWKAFKELSDHSQQELRTALVTSQSPTT
jgi:hypothetical protein